MWYYDLWMTKLTIIHQDYKISIGTPYTFYNTVLHDYLSYKSITIKLCKKQLKSGPKKKGKNWNEVMLTEIGERRDVRFEKECGLAAVRNWSSGGERVRDDRSRDDKSLREAMSGSQKKKGESSGLGFMACERASV